MMPFPTPLDDEPTEPFPESPEWDSFVCLGHPDQGLTEVYLVEGGEQFPWAKHNGKVIHGPPSPALLEDGTCLMDLEWNVSKYWVLAAIGPDGKGRELTPAEYAKATQ